MRNLWKRFGLVQRIIILITGILIIPTALICAVYYLTYWRALLSQVEDTLRRELNSMNTAMDTSLDEARAVLDRLEYGQELLYFMSADCPAPVKKLDGFLTELQEEWSDIRYAHPNRFSRLSIYTSNPSISALESWNMTLSYLGETDLTADDGEAAIYYGIPEAEKASYGMQSLDVVQSEPRVLPVWKYVREFRTNQMIGAVRLDIALEKLVHGRQLREEYPDLLFVLSDDTGNIYYQNGSFSQSPDPGLPADDEQVQQVRLEGEDWLMLSSRCAYTGLIRTVLVSKSQATRPASSMLFSVGAVALAGIILIMLLIALTVRQMLNRLMELDSVITQTGDGDLSASVQEDDYNDEITRIKHSYNRMTVRLRDVIGQLVEREKAQKDAELRALQAQINPHFLFNTLEAMRMQCEIDRYYKVEGGLSSLGKLLRYTLRWEHNEVPFRQEWDYLKSYLAVMSIRWENDFTFEMNCEADALQVNVPKMVLQPLVENSFQHGFRSVPPPWTLEIHASLEADRLRVLIRDNGGGIKADRLAEICACLEELRQPKQDEPGSHGIGLLNVAQRIHNTCKPGSGIQIGNRPDGHGVEIILTVIL